MNEYPHIKNAIYEGMRLNVKQVDGRTDAMVTDTYKMRMASGDTIEQALENLERRLKEEKTP